MVLSTHPGVLDIQCARQVVCQAHLPGTLPPEGKRFRGGLVLRLIDFVYDSTLGLRVIKKKKRRFGRNIRNSLPLGTHSSICLGSYGGPREGGGFLCARYPCRTSSMARRGRAACEKAPPKGLQGYFAHKKLLFPLGTP